MTLVELTVIISAAAVVLSTSAVLMHQIMRIQKKSQAFFDAERSAVRLSKQFRTDAHGAIEATIEADATGDKPFLQLQFADGESVAYSFSKGNVLRVNPRNNGVTTREVFAFSPIATFNIEEKATPRRLALSLTTTYQLPSGAGTRSPDPHAIPVYLEVEAVMNRAAQVTSEESP